MGTFDDAPVPRWAAPSRSTPGSGTRSSLAGRVRGREAVLGEGAAREGEGGAPVAGPLVYTNAARRAGRRADAGSGDGDGGARAEQVHRCWTNARHHLLRVLQLQLHHQQLMDAAMHADRVGHQCVFLLFLKALFPT